MKRLFFLSLALAAVGLSGCFVLSVWPFYTEKDLAFDPTLLGSWKGATETNTVWRFEREDTNVYSLTIRDNTETNLTQARLFKLGGHLFFDMFTPKVESDDSNKKLFPPPVPVHTLARVTLNAPEFRVALMNIEWLTAYLTNNPTALRHYLWKEKADNDEGFPIVTAETPELQKFVLQHYGNTNAWREESVYQRQPEAK
jgi:hypothetical protein